MSDDRLRRTPLFEEHLALGARMTGFAGWEMPAYYTGILEEHRAVRSSAGVFDACHMGAFRVFGFEAFDSLQGLLTNDLGRTAELGKGQYTLMLAEDGGIVDDLVVFHSGDLEYILIGNAVNRESDFEWLDERLPASVERVDESERAGIIALQGPKALDVVRDLAGRAFDPPKRFHVGEAFLDTVPVMLARTGYTGEDGVEIICHTSTAPAVWRLLLSFPEVTPCGLGARDTLRLEMGYPLYGSDMDRSTDPVSAGLSWALAMGKGDFVGREAVAAVLERGRERAIVGLSIPDGIPRRGYQVLHEGIEVGTVASGTFSPTLGHGIAIAYVPASLAEEGTEVQVAIRRRLARAVVTQPPFVKRTSLSG